MRTPGFSAAAALYRSRQSYYPAIPPALARRATVVPTQGLCAGFSAPRDCGAALATCEYYAPVSGGSDPTNCCQWYVVHCLPVAGGGGGGGGSPWKPPRGHLPE